MITRLNPETEVQRVILAALETDGELSGLTQRIYPPQAPNKPIRPFILYGVPIITPRKVDGADCADVEGAIHCFVDSGDGIPDAKAFASKAASHILRIIDEIEEIDLGEGMTLAVYVQQAQIIQDGSPSSWHSFVTYRAEAT